MDTTRPSSANMNTHKANLKTIGMEITAGDGNCYKHVHPDFHSVYDFTYWSRHATHNHHVSLDQPSSP